MGFTFLAGCAVNVPGGQWQVDRGVQRAFETGKVFPGHTYYYLGSISGPNSIIAIDNRFTLRTRVWAQVDITEQMLSGWMNWNKTNYAMGCDFSGGVILTPDGQQAGRWYSQNDINIIEMPEPGVLEVFQPHTVSGAVCGTPDAGMRDQ